MTLRWTIAAFHLLALLVGSAGIAIRASSLKRVDGQPEMLRSAIVGDALWGVAALLWIGSGVWRAFSGLEKDTAYYLSSAAFRSRLHC